MAKRRRPRPVDLRLDWSVTEVFLALTGLTITNVRTREIVRLSDPVDDATMGAENAIELATEEDP